MTALLIILSVILIAVVAVQIGKVSELAAKIRGEAEMEEINNKRQSAYLLGFVKGLLGQRSGILDRRLLRLDGF